MGGLRGFYTRFLHEKCKFPDFEGECKELGICKKCRK